VPCPYLVVQETFGRCLTTASSRWRTGIGSEGWVISFRLIFGSPSHLRIGSSTHHTHSPSPIHFSVIFPFPGVPPHLARNYTEGFLPSGPYSDSYQGFRRETKAAQELIDHRIDPGRVPRDSGGVPLLPLVKEAINVLCQSSHCPTTLDQVPQTGRGQVGRGSKPSCGLHVVPNRRYNRRGRIVEPLYFPVASRVEEFTPHVSWSSPLRRGEGRWWKAVGAFEDEDKSTHQDPSLAFPLGNMGFRVGREFWKKVSNESSLMSLTHYPTASSS